MLDLRLALSALVVCSCLVRPLSATWSILLVDTRTGEIAIGSATCLTRVDLRLMTPVVAVGRGVGVVQSAGDPTGALRVFIDAQLRAGTAPAEILDLLERLDPGHQSRQEGIVDVRGRAVSFSGSRTAGWTGGMTGSSGHLVWAIQGNLLAGSPVVQAAENAVRTTAGDLAQKLMAAMQAAHAMGGDGRCSCTSGPPTSCGSPPASFTKSAHVAYMIVARPGDTDGPCSGATGCAAGAYYLNHDVAGQSASSPDPVGQLGAMFASWTQAQVGRPDHFESTVTPVRSVLPADGQTSTDVRVVLRDRSGARLSRGGAAVRVRVAADTPPITAGAVVDHGDGSYSFRITAGNEVGSSYFEVLVDDGQGERLLSPPTVVRLTDDPLWVSRSELSVSAGGAVEFVLRPGSARAGRLFVLLASNSGSYPGLTLLGGLVLPLNPDRVFTASLHGAFGGLIPGLAGVTPRSGRAQTRVTLPRGSYALPAGTELRFAYAVLSPLDTVSNPVVIDLVR